MKKWILTGFIIPLLFPALRADNADLFRRGVDAYEQKQYPEAIAAWDSLARIEASAEVFYNLGNAYFRNHENGMAIAAWHAALQLDPRHTDALHNLRFAGADSDADSLHIRITGLFTENSWAFISLIALGWMSIALILIYRKPGKKAAMLLTFSMAPALFIALCAFGAAHIRKQWSKQSLGVVTAPFSEIRSEPSEQSISLIRADEGSCGEILGENERYWKMQLPGYEPGWILKTDVKILRPW